jgi:TetR/AcrR family transcriptional regulator
MASTRRPAEISRALIIDAATRILDEEGYAAVTAGRVADVVGLKRQIVHYYFRTIDELLVEVIRKMGDEGLARLRAELEAEEPLKVLWEMGNRAAVRNFELSALSLRRPVIGKEFGRYVSLFRKLESEAVERYFAKKGLAPNVPPAVAALTIIAVSQTLASDRALGVSSGHSETTRMTLEWMRLFGEGRAPSLTEPAAEPRKRRAAPRAKR